ncbi:MAG: hypothetical protein CEN89_45 [Candidatus Berkelbacteria bacterium Licking1014_7]|uniref:TraC-like domain-containing protein n=1 Tax=Candidatus Berkelbacteria bacterium Licking1014_7 TaxID=2017147 RepID=A0A554LKV9_9BACT|nr:MAG: hypothetical protein CEN89_45 [Candidatus Berkelbacteria bacterium Licking1014_7]
MPTTASTQQSVPIAQIRKSVAILKSGGIRAILRITPVNFALKSQQDQEVLVGQYQNFLNSLDFPVQLLVQSRKIDVYPYLKGLADFSQNISSDLLRIQIIDYINFVQKLTELANVMEKIFFCVVPYEPNPTENPSFLKKIFSSRPKISINKTQFDKYQSELEQRVKVIASGLEAMGLEVKRLDTQEIIEELYNIYNPGEAHEERLGKMAKIDAPIIHSKMKKPAPNTLSKPVSNLAHKLNPPSSQLTTVNQPTAEKPSQPQPAEKSQLQKPSATIDSQPAIASPQSPIQPATETKPTNETIPQTADIPSSEPAQIAPDQKTIDPQVALDAEAILKNLQ